MQAWVSGTKKKNNCGKKNPTKNSISEVSMEERQIISNLLQTRAMAIRNNLNWHFIPDQF